MHTSTQQLTNNNRQATQITRCWRHKSERTINQRIALLALLAAPIKETRNQLARDPAGV
jgi:hypothetical protein